MATSMNSKSKICFGTVIYTQAREYLPELIDSIEAQTDKDFEILIINDNYPPTELNGLGISTLKNAQIVDYYGKNLTPGLLRIELIEQAKKAGFDLLIVGDADDTFSPNRVESVRAAYEIDKKAVFYYNSLATKDGIEVLKNMPAKTCDIHQISQCNYLGMSTTAINLSMLSYDFIDSLKQGDCRIFDWYLFSRIVLDLGYGVYVDDAKTIYRIHEGNIVGISHDLTQEREVKLAHYKNLAKHYPYFKYLYEKLEKLDLTKIDTSESLNGYWWSNIKMEDSYEI